MLYPRRQRALRQAHQMAYNEARGALVQAGKDRKKIEETEKTIGSFEQRIETLQTTIKE